MRGSLLMLGLAGPELTPDEIALIAALQPAGFFLCARNLIATDQTRRLTDSLRDLSRSHPLIAIAHPGGPASPTGNFAPPLPAPAALAALADSKTTGTAGLLTGELLRLLGINLNLAPTLDGHWGRDPQRIIDHAGQWNRWLRKRGVASCAGRFPAAAPSTATAAELQRAELLPYTALMPELDAILLSHAAFPNLDPEFPAALSSRIIRRLLRDQLGFDHHLVLTDALDQPGLTAPGPAARLAIQAGNDLVLITHRPELAPIAAAAIATLPHLARAEAWERVDRLRDKLHWPTPWSATTWHETHTKLAAAALASASAGLIP
jgi:beta-N-acetylhexosaminidase